MKFYLYKYKYSYIYIFIILLFFNISLCKAKSPNFRKRVSPSYMSENQLHMKKLKNNRNFPEITIWDSDFQPPYDNPNNFFFCHSLKSKWFKKINNRHQKANFSDVDLKEMGLVYMEYVYTPMNFPHTWRDPDTWRNKKGKLLHLRKFDEDEIKRYYFSSCSKPASKIRDRLMYLFKITSIFIVLFMVIVFFILKNYFKIKNR